MPIIRLEPFPVGAFDVEFDFEPKLTLVAAAFELLGERFEDFEEVYERIIDLVIIPSVTQTFLDQYEGRWPPLADSTVQRKPEWKNDPLIRSGELQFVATTDTPWSVLPEYAVAVLPDFVWYGNVHQSGAVIGGGPYRIIIPQREFFSLRSDDMEAIVFVFNDWVREQLDETLGPGWRGDVGGF